MAGNSELFTALQMFNQGVQQAATSSAISEATQQVGQIQSQIQDAGQQRQALDSLSKQLALRLTGVGAPAAAIQQAMQAVGPKQYGSVAEMQMDAALTGNPFLKETSKSLMDQATKSAKQMKLFEHGLDMDKLGAQGMNALQLQMLKGQADKQAASKITADELAKLNAVDEQLGFGRDLLKRMESGEALIPGASFVGPMSGRTDTVLNPDKAAFQADLGRFFDAYRQAVTGAGASEKEIERLETRMPQPTDTAGVFKRKMEYLLKYAQDKKNVQIKNWGLTGRDVGGLLQGMKAEQQAKQAKIQSLQRLQQFSGE
jgi:hypothetical protein